MIFGVNKKMCRGPRVELYAVDLGSDLRLEEASGSRAIGIVVELNLICFDTMSTIIAIVANVLSS